MIKDSIPDHFRHSTLLKTPLGLAPNLIIKHPKTEVRSKKGKIYGLWWFLDPNTARPELRPEQIIKRQVMWEFKVIQCQSHPALTTEDLLGPGDQAVYELSANCRATSASRAIEVKFIFTGRAIAPLHHPRREREWSSCCHKRRMVGKNQFQRQSPHGLANNLPTASNTTYGRKWWVGRKRQ